MKVRCVELFSGVGAQRMALTRLMAKHPDLEVEFVAQCDIDKFAVRSYNAIHGETPNLGDVSKLERLPDCDLLTWSFPCQDLSLAGNKKGMERESGTRSALCWEVVRLLNVSNRPKWLLMENVPAILFKSNIGEFEKLCRALENLGYRNKYGILNATDFDIAQSRKRCFMISVLGENAPDLPKGKGLRHVMKHYLEDDVDEKYYLSEERLKGLTLETEKQKAKGNNYAFETTSTEGQSKTINPKEGDRKYTNFFETARVVGYLSATKKTQHFAVYERERERETVSPTICACDWKDPMKLLIR